MSYSLYKKGNYFNCACPILVLLNSRIKKHFKISFSQKLPTHTLQNKYIVQSRTVGPSEINGSPYLRNLSLNDYDNFVDP